MWTEHTEYEEDHKLQECTVVRYQHNNTLGKTSSNYRYRKNIEISFFFQYRTPLITTDKQCTFAVQFPGVIYLLITITVIDLHAIVVIFF